MPTTARLTSRRNVMRIGVATLVAALGRTPLAFADDDADDGEVVPFLEPQPFDPKIPSLHWDELKLTDWMTPTPQVYHVKHYGDVKRQPRSGTSPPASAMRRAWRDR